MVQGGAFGHGGGCGSVGFADPKAGFGYVMDKVQMAGDDHPRTVSLTQAVHASLKG